MVTCMETGPDRWGMLGAGGRGGHISGFNKNVKILYFVTKLLQGRQITHKSVTDFPEIRRAFHAEGREFGAQVHLEFYKLKNGNGVGDDDLC